MASVAGLFRHLEHAHHAELPEALADMAARLSNRATALHHDGEQLQARARLLQDELMAKLSEQSNQLLYFLSMMTAVLLPMTIISGLFGMNVGGIPLADSAHGFWTGLDLRSRGSGGCALCAEAYRPRRHVISAFRGACEHRPGIDRQRRSRSARTPPRGRR